MDMGRFPFYLVTSLYFDLHQMVALKENKTDKTTKDTIFAAW